ncbi:hypothetical protein [Fluviicola chungangensis]|uniref:Uncharacterized protein n=1 Tax=Fluviicola chungangensis TaxID=2597671 RepID=A0A556N6P0_9FLAO|nr:hypothetical protein [Fluviicola chungangensis]TSJ47815.1 hypothetical protein FO442_01420 [Fluviicola chungangensis]
MRILLILFLGMASLIVRAQQEKDSVRLVDIQSSECGGIYYVKPHFLGKETIGDTTFISLSCSNNCAGYNNPEVRLSEDSVLISIHYGAKTTRLKLLNGKYIHEEDMNLHPKDSILEEVTETFAACDCCYIFNLKIVGLNNPPNYLYFYNKEFIDPNYKELPRKRFELPTFSGKTDSKICRDIYKIVSKDKSLLKESPEFHVILSVDTSNCTFKSIMLRFEQDEINKSIADKLKSYFQSQIKINCNINKDESILIQDYRLIFEYNKESDKLIMSIRSDWRIPYD